MACPHLADGAWPQLLCWPGARAECEHPDRLSIGAAAHPTAELKVFLTLHGDHRPPGTTGSPPNSQKPQACESHRTRQVGIVLENDPERRKLNCCLEWSSYPHPHETKKHFHSSPNSFLRKKPPREGERKQARNPQGGTRALLRALPEARAVGPCRHPQHRPDPTPAVHSLPGTVSQPRPCSPPPATETTCMGPAHRSSWQEVQGPMRHQQPWVGEPEHLILGWSC